MRISLIVAFLTTLVFAVFSIQAGPMIVNINTATAQELDDSLPGIGPSKAKAIVWYRQTHGYFKDLADVDKVPGIGPKILDDIKHSIKFGERASIEPTATESTTTQPTQTKPTATVSTVISTPPQTVPAPTDSEPNP